MFTSVILISIIFLGKQGVKKNILATTYYQLFVFIIRKKKKNYFNEDISGYLMRFTITIDS